MIEITRENFPLHDILLAAKNSAVDIQADFDAAVSGSDEQKYTYALGLQTVARNVPASAIPGCDDEVMHKTLRSCRTLFKELAEGGHEPSRLVYQEYQAMKIGL